ncbi:SDR family NAD(P)-dependent oxidoreductase [Raineyella sp. LH-20]|uniref:SDR family NAD(P)-dependent oxidoreductase n=1 Tax=Raineyella sp. LH-20 TaxID=3081204 RepID=UPI002955B4FA|nr:SDR family NAD(P)-dependent oxidoreductase [Raineyella sp. LH-20]WOP19634.1 SDR family NAD(P)-dependent oxidoreductase [Raineyella sp. LH-20]
MNGRFAGRVAVVTGAAQGIGAAVAGRLVDEGARVLVTDRDRAAAATTATRLGPAAAPAEVDVTDKASVEAIPEHVRQAFGSSFDLMVCNAGIQTWTRGTELTTEEWDSVLDVNARGVLYSLQLAGRAMTAAVPGSAGAPAVVAMASIQARLPGPFYPHYSASKAAILSLVKSFAAELAERGIRVNAVAPGIVETEIWERADQALSAMRGQEPGVARRQRVAAVPLRRAGTPEDVAAATAFLLSPDASYITGECLHVCGGDVML